MKRILQLLGLGGLAVLPALAGSCFLTSSSCMSGLVGTKAPVPVSVNFSSPVAGHLDTLTLTGLTFNGNVAKAGSFSLTQGPSSVDANISGAAFAAGTTTVTVGMTFSFAGPDALSAIVGTDMTQGTVGKIRVTTTPNGISLSEVVTLDPTGSLFSLTNLFEINQRSTGTLRSIVSKSGGQLFDANGLPLFNPNAMLAPTSAPEPMSLALVGLSLVAGATFTMRRRRQKRDRDQDKE